MRQQVRPCEPVSVSGAVGQLVEQGRVVILRAVECCGERHLYRVKPRGVGRSWTARNQTGAGGQVALYRCLTLDDRVVIRSGLGQLRDGHPIRLVGVEYRIDTEYEPLFRLAFLVSLLAQVALPEHDPGALLTLPNLAAGLADGLVRRPVRRRIPSLNRAHVQDERIDPPVGLARADRAGHSQLGIPWHPPGGHPSFKHGNELVGNRLVGIELLTIRHGGFLPWWWVVRS